MLSPILLIVWLALVLITLFYIKTTDIIVILALVDALWSVILVLGGFVCLVFSELFLLILILIIMCISIVELLIISLTFISSLWIV